MRFASDSAKNDFSTNVVVNFKARTGGHSLHLSGNSIRPSRVVRNLWSDINAAPARTAYTREICGHDYVSYVETGVSLVAVLKVEFQNEYDRKAMGGTLGASILGGLVSVDVSTDFEEVLRKSGVKLTLSAIQEGGNPALLNAIVGGGGAVRIPKLIGVARMTDMMLTGRVYNAVDGERIGLAQYHVPTGTSLEKALDLAQRIATNAPLTNYALMHALPRIAEQPADHGYLTEALISSIAQAAPEAKARVRAFLEGKAAKVQKS